MGTETVKGKVCLDTDEQFLAESNRGVVRRLRTHDPTQYRPEKHPGNR